MCPDENVLLKFASGGAADLPALETHLDSCESCRRAVAAAASELTLPTAPTTRVLGPGQRVDRYEIERELGRGGMGIVYQARDVTLDRRVALKLLHAQRNEVAQARLLREAQVMAKLTHPNVVPVFELGEWRSDLYLVMELVAGVTLEQWLKREKHRRGDILRTFVQAGRGLAAAHASGVVHRDFKPANVLVGLDGRVRVTDFGLSRPGPSLELPATDSAVVTRDGAIVGTLAYMSPEQLEGRVADERSDQFSFCVSLVEALTGLRPFEGDTWAHLQKSLDRAPRLAGVPRALRDVLRKGLQRDAARRYTSLTALLNAIERSQQLGWTAVGLTAAVAAAVGLVIAAPWRPAPAPIAATNTVPVAVYELVPVVTAAVDMEVGTVVRMEDLQQREMPTAFVTSSVVKPDSVSYIVGQKLVTPILKGDPVLWSQFETTRTAAAEASTVTVLTAARDLPAGTVLDAEALEHHAIPEELATDSVLRPVQSAHVWGHALKTAVKKGDLLLRSNLSEGVAEDEVVEFLKSQLPALSSCFTPAPKGVPSARLLWTVHADGSAFDVKLDEARLHGGALESCLSKRVGALHFPKSQSDVRTGSLELVFAN